MKTKILYPISILLLFFCLSLNAENRITERVFVHTDKNSYIAGEDILLKFYVVDNYFQPSVLSKVGYVEISDTNRPQMQLMLALENGRGAGVISIPRDIPTGIYQLSAYTRYMRNEGENAFFRKQIAIVNPAQQFLDVERFELIDEFPIETTQATRNQLGNLRVKTDRNEYGNREKVQLSIENIPENTVNLVVSVSRNDSIALVPSVNKTEWLSRARNTFPFSNEWLPEYEGHIITGRFSPEPDENLLASVAFVGDDIRFFNGQIKPQNGLISFYTAAIFGRQQIVTSATASQGDEKVPFRVDLISPFCESLPKSLPVLQIFPNESQIMDRYIGVQLQERMNSDRNSSFVQTPKYSALQPSMTYDLDEYVRFSSIRETIIEFVSGVRVTRMRDRSRVISLFMEDLQRNSLRTLILLDGIPIFDHEDILAYNPMHIRRMDIFNEHYVFGGRDFEGIISFVTHDANLPFFQLDENSQLLIYQMPQLPPLFEVSEMIENSRKPDFRHTLYWNPFVEITAGKPIELSFYTSDLSGEFKITVEGFTNDGRIIQNVSYFTVTEPIDEK